MDTLVQWAAAQDAVRAVVLTGSRGVPQPNLDSFSDYDVILYVTNRRQFTDDSTWLNQFGRILVRLSETGPDAGEPSMRLVLYEDGTKVDFTIAGTQELRTIASGGRLPAGLDHGYQVLLDKDGVAAALPPATHAAYFPKRPTQDEFTALVEEFWWETTYVAKHLARDELLPAKHSLEVVIRLDLLRRLLEWRIGATHDWAVGTGVHGRRFKQLLDQLTWSELEATFADADIEANWQALFDLSALFRRVANDVAARLRLSYPNDLDARVTDYLRRVHRNENPDTRT